MGTTRKSKATTTRGPKAPDSETLLATLKARFSAHPKRHAGISWAEVEARLSRAPDKLASLSQMESTGGEPDVIGKDEKSGAFLFCDCAAESPSGRRSLCYDVAAHQARKEHKPSGSAQGLADEMGVELLDEAHYRALQRLGAFDQKTSSWIKTPEPIRKLGGALFGDRRYDAVFVYHNGAESYYAARGFRAVLRV